MLDIPALLWVFLVALIRPFRARLPSKRSARITSLLYECLINHRALILLPTPVVRRVSLNQDTWSITDPVIQRSYIDYVLALDSILHPDYLGLAAETNLIRLAAPDSVYQAVVAMTNAAATQLQQLGVATPLYVSVQVETAWGRFQGGGYAGIGQDLADFPFIDCLGLSSYPYLGGFADLESVPPDYYARLRTESARPVLVVEGGWTSTSLGFLASSPAEQARYLASQGRLLDSARAIAVFQLTFTDLDLSALNLPAGSGLPLFAHLGVVDSALRAKPALAAWDEVFARPFAP